MKTSPIPFRQIHLDFHTGPAVPNVGAAFDATTFAAILAEARVESVTLFAKCHHGHLYFDTDHPARHPTLRRPLLEEQVAALHERGIRCPIYLSVQCDEYAANTNPGWIALNADGSRVGQRPFACEPFTWQILDMSSPYLDYFEQQVIAVLEKFRPVDGLFFDMCWDQPSSSAWAKAGMRERGLDPASERDRARYSRIVAHRYMERLTKLVARVQKRVPLFFNSRPQARLPEEKHFLRHVEVEALPTGQWGYAYFPVNVRFAKTMGLPLVGMTGRFHKSWADFGGLRTVPSLTYDCAQALAHGGACSIGDQLHPSGVMDRGVYQVIGDTYRHVAQCEPWVKGATAVKEIAVLYRDPATHPLADAVHEGVMRVLTQLHRQFVFLPPDAAWEDYPVLIVPETIERTKELEARIRRYLSRGGAVLREDLTGEKSPYSCTYLRFDDSSRGTLPVTDHVFYEAGARLKPRKSDRVLARIVEPYFERAWDHFSSHVQTAAKTRVSPYIAGVTRRREAIFALPVFRAYARHANLPCRQLVAAALETLLPDPVLKVRGPSYLEAVVSDQPSRRIVHLLSYIPQKRTPTLEMVEEAVAVRNVELELQTPRPPTRVSLQPGDEPLAAEPIPGGARIRIDWIEGHRLVVAQFGAR